MEGCSLVVRGDDPGRVADAFVDRKARAAARSLDRRGVRNLHRYRGDGFTHVVYERAAAHSEDWVTVTLLAERTDDRAATVLVLVGGGGEGPFKLEELSVERLLAGDDATGAAGRFAAVLRDVLDVCDDLGLSAETAWESDDESTTTAERLLARLLD